MSLKHDKFVELAEKRVNKAIKQIDLIGNLSNKNNYDYSESEVKKIIGVLKKEIKKIEDRFSGITDNNKFFRL